LLNCLRRRMKEGGRWRPARGRRRRGGDAVVSAAKNGNFFF
jgi:hypothetical protein